MELFYAVLGGVAIVLLFVLFVYCASLYSESSSDGSVDKGSAGERALYHTLVSEIGMPTEYILTNVYIPIGNDMTTELDLVAVTKKGVFVFECKNYAGNIYGDAKREQWIQYVGKKKSYFYNPLKQNLAHCAHMRKYLSFFGSIPVVSLVSVTNRGNWKVKNLGPKDHLLGYNCHFMDIYNNMEDSIVTELNRNNIIRRLKEMENPGEDVKQKHIRDVRRMSR